MRIELIGVECPVLPGVTVGIQRRAEVIEEHPADGSEIRWAFEADWNGADLRGPYIHGRPGARFVYLSWARAPGGRFRRAKLMLDAVPADVMLAAETSGLEARVRLAMSDGSPLCAAARPPVVTWRAAG